jgi:serine/threonine protein kinase
MSRCVQCDTPLTPGAAGNTCSSCLSRRETAAPTGEPVVALPADVAALQARLPQFQILDAIGQGGMGVVYKARQKHLDRLIAIKTLSPAITAVPAFQERFAREAKALGKLNHPHIVGVYDFGVAEGDPPLYWLAMEYVQGQSLRSSMRDLPTEGAIGLLLNVCDALQYAHDEGLVHRDIKPENILLDRHGRSKIADFGLARLVTTADARLTTTQSVMGTPHYMAPEQFERPGEVDHRADLYALGVVAYELLTGELPIGRFDLPSAKRDVDPRLDAVILKALEKDPARRQQSARELADELRQASSPRPAIEYAHQRPELPAAPARSIDYPFRLGWRLALAVIAIGLFALVGAYWHLAGQPQRMPGTLASNGMPWPDYTLVLTDAQRKASERQRNILATPPIPSLPTGAISLWGPWQVQRESGFAQPAGGSVVDDPGIAEHARTWSRVPTDDQRWPKRPLPALFDDWGKDFAGPGAFWIRKTVDLPPAWNGTTLELNLGFIDDGDQAWWDGQPIGQTDWRPSNSWQQRRSYTIPANLVRPGQHVITVRIWNKSDEGGVRAGWTEFYLAMK